MVFFSHFKVDRNVGAKIFHFELSEILILPRPRLCIWTLKLSAGHSAKDQVKFFSRGVKYLGIILLKDQSKWKKMIRTFLFVNLFTDNIFVLNIKGKALRVLLWYNRRQTQHCGLTLPIPFAPPHIYHILVIQITPAYFATMKMLFPKYWGTATKCMVNSPKLKVKHPFGHNCE